ncbi:hypothetical protein GCM10010833_31930 [Blastomonas aquatica]|uniref:Flagellar assembly protein FliH/Type III secretion system HrpE domain-containing protein n=2 Tax=Blastomonas aquatica TaxID=1510276 RepID=A0ABQ1JSN1_9SPHN|nr:hypothetical protein GCM10010833_31930 [Blastomonas aquatica]
MTVEAVQNRRQILPFAFDRTFPSQTGDGPRMHRRKTDAIALANEVEALQEQIARLEEGHRDELALVRSEAFAAGLDHARTEREEAILAAIDAAQASLETLAIQHEELRHEVVADACQLALTAAEILAGCAIDREPGRPIDEAIGRALLLVTRGQEIEVRVHPDLVEDITQRIAVRQAGDRRRLFLSVSADPAIVPGDAALTWERGGLLVDAASRRQAVLDELEPLTAASEADSQV